jgi:putative redox protein
MTKIREVVVASDPTNHGALVGRVDASQFPIGGPDGAGYVSPGPNPYDLLSASLAACTAMTVRFHARRRALPLERVEVGVSFHHGAQGVGAILGVSADIRTRPDATISAHRARTQVSYEDDLAQLPIPNITPD